MGWFKTLDEIVTGVAFAATNPVEAFEVARQAIRKDFYTHLHSSNGGNTAMSFQHTMRQVASRFGLDITILDNEACSFSIFSGGGDYTVTYLSNGFLCVHGLFQYRPVPARLTRLLHDASAKSTLKLSMTKRGHIFAAQQLDIDDSFGECVQSMGGFMRNLEIQLSDMGL